MWLFCLMWAGFILDSLKASMKAKILLCGEVRKRKELRGLSCAKLKLGVIDHRAWLHPQISHL